MDKFQQAPIRNDSTSGVDVYTHSGEFSPWAVDLALPSRGISFSFMRTYRSSASGEFGPLGRAWTFNYAQRLEQQDQDILYHDNVGRTYHFAKEPGTNAYRSPDGFYSILESGNGEMLLKQRYGNVFIFETPEAGGRLRAIADRTHNALRFEHTIDATFGIDSLGRRITITYAEGRVHRLEDHTGRIWRYQYNADGCLIEVTQPPLEDATGETRIRYEYDDNFRLSSVTDPNAQTFLRNVYDSQGRVARQVHGAGVFEFLYKPIGEAGGFPIYRTDVRIKNGTRLTLEHNSSGHVIKRMLQVSVEGLSSEASGGLEMGTVPVLIQSEFNRHGELTRRVFANGNITEWQYDEGHDDARARGNLLAVIRRPTPGVDADQSELVTRYAYEPSYQRCSEITNARGHITALHYDAQGNLRERRYPPVTVQQVVAIEDGSHPIHRKHLADRFEYNRAGQLVRSIDSRGAATEYHYYAAGDPTGNGGRAAAQFEPETPGGYLARLRVDPPAAGRRVKGKPADLIREFGYDLRGNVTSIWDGNGNPTRLTYDAHDRPTSLISRAPFNHVLIIRRDQNGNVIETETTFDRFEYDSATSATRLNTSTLRCLYQYNALNNVEGETFASGEQEITHTFVRDASESIVRAIQPLGNITEYRFDERDLLLEQRLAVGTSDETSSRHTYSRAGRLSSSTNARGDLMRRHYDGFGRYRGFTDAIGASKKQSFDPASNVTHIEVTGDPGVDAPSVSLLETSYEYDELNRCTRRDRAWREALNGALLGRSRWDGRDGVVSTVIEYDDNHVPLRTWSETGNVQSWFYDGANRVIAASDATGESVAIEYDANGNRALVERLGPAAHQERFQQSIRQEFDELDRVAARSINASSPETFSYNALSQLTEYRDRGGSQTLYLHDGFGRSTGQASEAVTHGANERQLLVQRVEWNENNLVTSSVDEGGRQTRYQYNALNCCKDVVYADGSAKHFGYDQDGNARQVVDGNGNVVNQRFDALNRLVERCVGQATEEQRLETFRYDGLNRLVAAAVPGVTTTRRYDSLSRVLEETQAGRTLGCNYDAAGNVIALRYPSGQEVHKSYDVRNRVLEVRDGANRMWAKYTYRSGGQLESQMIGDVIEASFSYRSVENWLTEVAYRSAKDGKLVAASRYQYDRAGNRTQEEQPHQGKSFGERYVYDSVNRLVGVQYGVEDLQDSQSNFQQEVTYELSETATWRRKTVKGAEGNIVEQLDGATNARGAYVALGERRFAYDANGNRRVESGAGAEKRYFYDSANRLTRVEFGDGVSQDAKSIEYIYDAFNRQALRRITDANGTTERARTWNGVQLLEEWDDGEVARQFVYGARINEPVVMTRFSHANGEHFLYTFNGRGFVTGLVNEAGSVVERYRYDVYQRPSVDEIVSIASDHLITTSSVGNPLLSPGRIWDSDVQLYSGSSTYDPTTGQVVAPVAPTVADIDPIFVGLDGGQGVFVGPVTVITEIDPVFISGDTELDPVFISPDWNISDFLEEWNAGRKGGFFDGWKLSFGGSSDDVNDFLFKGIGGLVGGYFAIPKFFGAGPGAGFTLLAIFAGTVGHVFNKFS